MSILSKISAWFLIPDDSASSLPGGGRGRVGPTGVRIGPRTLTLPDGVCAPLVITGYPAEITPGWLDPLLADTAQIEVSVHLEPLPIGIAADRLRKQISRLESSRRFAADHGRLQDPALEVSAQDAHELAARLARAEGKLFRVGVYLTVHAADDSELAAEVARLRALASSLLLDAQPTTFRALQGWTSCLPVGVDAIRLRRSFDTDAAAALFPFASPDLTTTPSATSVLYGVSIASGSPVIWDRFACANYNSVILATSGAGKSYLGKLEISRSLLNGIECCVIDPETEYARLANAAGGAYLHLGAPGVRLNPLDLPEHPAPGSDAFLQRALFLHTLVPILTTVPADPGRPGQRDGTGVRHEGGRGLGARAKAVLDRAIIATYNTAGITSDPHTWRRPAPLLADLAQTLEADDDPAGAEVAARLAPYVTGTHRGLFDGPTTTRPDSHLIVFSLRELADELRPAASVLALDWVWRRVTHTADRRPRLVVVDEAWLLMQTPEGAAFLQRLAKSARKYWCGLTCISQDVDDLLASPLGRSVITNAATQILLRQAPQAIDQLTQVFKLSAGEAAFLTSAQTGEALLACGHQRVAFAAIASDREDAAITTDPTQLTDPDHPLEDDLR